MKTPRRPVPRAKLTNVPRPYREINTAPLLKMVGDLESGPVADRRRELDALLDIRAEMLFELERRDVSYRQMGRATGLTPMTITRFLDGRRPVLVFPDDPQGGGNAVDGGS